MFARYKQKHEQSVSSSVINKAEVTDNVAFYLAASDHVCGSTVDGDKWEDRGQIWGHFRVSWQLGDDGSSCTVQKTTTPNCGFSQLKTCKLTCTRHHLTLELSRVGVTATTSMSASGFQRYGSSSLLVKAQQSKELHCFTEMSQIK